MDADVRGDGRHSRWKGWVVVAVAAAAFLATRAAARAGMDHFSTWSYQWSWYPFLLAVDGVLAGSTGRFALLSRPRFALSLWLWSAPVWFFFELLNLRLANWFYVGVPPSALERWTGYFLAFATVLPAIWLPLAALERAGLASGLAAPSFRVGRPVLRGVAVAGVLFLILPLWRPELFYPLVWGAPALLLAPWNHRQDPESSLLGELGAGRCGRLVRLLAAGLAAGVAWEGLNWFAGGRWIYTVPGLEEVKIFEMPVAGFLGFPAFAVECAVIYRALVNAGVAVPDEAGGRVPSGTDPSGAGEGAAPPTRAATGLRRGRSGAAALAALVFSLAVAAGVDRWTVASIEPSLGQLPAVGAAAAELRRAGIADPGELARADSASLSRRIGVGPERAGAWIRSASLAELRGLGARGTRALWGGGIRSVCGLARAQEPDVIRLLQPGGVLGPARGRERRARVWIRAARETCPGGGPSPARTRIREARPEGHGSASGHHTGAHTGTTPGRDPGPGACAGGGSRAVTVGIVGYLRAAEGRWMKS